MNNTGLPGVALDDRDHVCVLYRGPAERDSVLGAFFDAGHAEGDKCLCIADDQDPAAVAARLDPEHHRGPDQLTVLPATAYLTDGRFEPQQVYEQWNSVTERYVDDGYRHVRGAGHTIGLGRARTGADGALGIHVSTLKYRLGRIEAVTGRSLSQPDVRFQLQVALTVQHTLTVLLGKREP